MTNNEFQNLPGPVAVLEARVAVLQRYLGEATARTVLLEDVLRAAVAHTELFTGNGCREQPPEWARMPDGEFNAEEIAKRGRALLASFAEDRAPAEGEPCNARTWRLTPAGAWVYRNAEGASLGNVYRSAPGTWVGSPWGREIASFETAQEAKAHVEKMFRS